MNLEILNKYYEDGWLIKSTHPTLPLTIWNYSIKTQYKGYWNEITLQCRGLVTDDKGNVIARPFKKFFNIEEGKYTPTSNFTVTEKVDGSLIIVFNYNGNWIAASRGSFTSDHAVAASKILSPRYFRILNTNITYLFEYTSQWSRIVIDYGEEENLTLLGAIITETGIEMPRFLLKLTADDFGCDLVKKYDGIYDFTKLKGMVKDGHEGFVVRFSNGDRMKVKGEEYIRLHRIMTEISTKRVWEVLSEGKDMDIILDNVPDEFYDKIKKYEKKLRYFYYQMSEKVGKLFDYKMYGKYNDKEPITDKKEFAEWVFKQEVWMRPILFNMFNKKDYSKIIWKLLKPEFKKL